MFEFIGKNRELCEKVSRELKKLIEGARKTLKPKLVILYGSIARGEWREGSDIDLLIVSDSAPSNFIERTSALQGIVQGFPIEPHIYTTREFDQMLIHGRMTALDALTEGIIIFAEKSYLKEIRGKLKQTMEKLKPEKMVNGWKIKQNK